MAQLLTDVDRVTLQKALDHLQDGDQLAERIDSQLGTILSGQGVYALETLRHACSRLLVVRAKLQTARDQLAGVLDRMNERRRQADHAEGPEARP